MEGQLLEQSDRFHHGQGRPLSQEVRELPSGQGLGDQVGDLPPSILHGARRDPPQHPWMVDGPQHLFLAHEAAQFHPDLPGRTGPAA